MKNIQDDSKPVVTILISVETKEKVHWSADTWETMFLCVWWKKKKKKKVEGSYIKTLDA